MPTITLDRPLIDYITFTSWEESFHDVSQAILAKMGGKIKEGVKRLQYTGWQTVGDPLGTLFYGEGMQKGRFHAMMQVSGELCNEPDVLNPLVNGFREGWLNCRRLDLQMTIERPDDWQQWGFFNRQKRGNRKVGWVESTSKAGKLLQTVYLGARESGKFLRLYEKEFADKVLLRAEYELKGNYSEAYARMLWKAKENETQETPSTLLKLLLTNTRDEQLHALYLPALEWAQTAAKPKVLVAQSKTDKWLLETVLPTFRRVISDHDSDGEVLAAYAQAIAEFYRMNDINPDDDMGVIL